jgi:hypothetical protein
MQMTNPTSRVRFRRLATGFGLAAATLLGPLAGVSYADDHDRRAEVRHDRGPDHGWREGYYHRPDIYYSAPPVIYPPMGYYQQPSATLNFSFPLILR